MKRVNTFDVYKVGIALKPVLELKTEGVLYKDVLFLLWEARSEVQTFVSSPNMSLRLCKQSASVLVNAITSVVPNDLDTAINNNRDKEVNWWQLTALKTAAEKFQTVLAEELNILETYSVLQKGAYSTTDLVERAEVMFPENVRQQLTDQTIFDVQQAGKCLAFETPTAAAFHISRAIESMLIEYYSLATKKGSPPSGRNWGVYLSGIEKSTAADKKILSLLRHIKDQYRNPTSHPESRMTVDEAIVYLGTAVSAITQIAITNAKLRAAVA